MLNCSNCGYHIPLNKEYHRQISKKPVGSLNIIKRTNFRQPQEYKKQVVCQLCARKIDRIKTDRELYQSISLLITLMIVIYIIYCF